MSTVNRTYVFDTIISGGTRGTSVNNVINFDIDTFSSGSTIDNYSYLGFGTLDNCKILRVHTEMLKNKPNNP